MLRRQIKGMLLRMLPERALRFLKKVHYARTMDILSAEDQIEFQVIRALVGPGDAVVDIGANVGVFTKHLSDLAGPSGRVYSIEPMPLNFEILCHCINKRGLSNVTPIHAAISDAVGRVTMELPTYESGGDNYYEARIAAAPTSNSQKHVQVEAKTIDTLFPAETRPITFIKIDVEGHELRCLLGAGKFLEGHQPAWLIEVWGDPDEESSSASQLFLLLKQRGYETYWSQGGKARKRRPGDKSVNYFFLTAIHTRILRDRGLLIDDAG